MTDLRPLTFFLSRKLGVSTSGVEKAPSCLLCASADGHGSDKGTPYNKLVTMPPLLSEARPVPGQCFSP